MSKIVQLLAKVGEDSAFKEHTIEQIVEQNELNFEEKEELIKLLNENSKFAAIFFPAKDDEDEDTNDDSDDDSDDDSKENSYKQLVNA